MSPADVQGANENALDSVRQIERTLEERQDMQKVSQERLAAAREEAEEIVAAARREGEAAAEERRRRVLAAAEEEAGRILETARAGAEELRERAARDRAAAAGAVAEWILPGGEA